VIEMKRIVSWQLPIKAASEANSSEHWTKKAKRHGIQKFLVKRAYHCDKPEFIFPCTVTLTRIAPRTLDLHDNLRMSLKWVADAVSECLIPGKAAGRADDDKRITWEYRQEKGKPREYAVKIEIMGDYETTD
jgi:hypothetical protein